MRAAFRGLGLAILFFATVAAADGDAGVDDAGVDDATAIVARAEHGNVQTRKECEQLLILQGEAAVPALIVCAKKSAKDSPQQKFCEGTLADLGKRSAADEVQTESDEALIGVFGAFAQVRDIDALSAIFPFVGAERKAIRDAARDALRNYGDRIHSRLRAEYINIGGQIPANFEPSTSQLLDSYFALRDQLRLQDVTALFSKGLIEAKTDLPSGITDLDSALAREPLLENRNEAAPFYVQYAYFLSKSDRATARAYDLKAMRLAGDGTPDANRAASALAFFDAEDLRAKGIVDRKGYEQAITLDPQNEDAKGAIDALDAAQKDREDALKKKEAAVAAAVAVTAFFFAGLLFAIRNRREK